MVGKKNNKKNGYKRMDLPEGWSILFFLLLTRDAGESSIGKYDAMRGYDI